jgi:drug/metabolite transporter (DMT)-like permease
MAGVSSSERPRGTVVAVLSLLGATLFWAGNYVVGEAAVATIDPASLVFLRWLFAAVPLIVIARLVERPSWRQALRAWPWLLALSVTGVVGYTLLLYGALQYTSAFNASLINAFNPALIALAAAVFLRERLTATSVIGVLLALAGVLIVLSRGDLGALASDGFGLGDLLMIGAILAWTVYTILGRVAPKVPPITATAVQAVIAAALMAPVTLLTGGPALPADGAGWWALAYIVIFPSVLSYLLWNRALTVIPPGRAGVFLNLLTVFTAVLTVLTGQAITLPQILGGLVILAGIAIANTHVFRRSPRPGVPARP